MAKNKKISRVRVARFFAQWLVYPLCYYLVGYRKKVVRQNLQRAFPDKDAAQLLSLEKAFYHQFANLIMEIIVGGGFSQQDLLSYFTYHGATKMRQACQQHGGCFIMMGHFINWEWQSCSAAFLTHDGQECGVVYKQLANGFFDSLMRKLRERRGGFFIEMNQLLRVIVKRKQVDQPIPTYYAMLADQRPRKQSKQHWTAFLGVETDFLMGTEQLARKYAFPVYYAYIRITEQNDYDVTFVPLYDPQKEAQLPTGEITERFARTLEQNVNEIPERWLWTHKRFAHKRPTTPNA